MTSSPKFWQKLGLGKHNKSIVFSTNNSDNTSNSLQSSISYNNVQDATNNEKQQMKRFSSNNMSLLRHRASSASLRQQIVTQEKPAISRRSSCIKTLHRIEPATEEEESISMPCSHNENIKEPSHNNNIKLPQQRKASFQQIPIRKQSCVDLGSMNNNYTNIKLPLRLQRTKSNQSLVSACSGSRPNGYSNTTNTTTNSATTSSKLRQPSPVAPHARILHKSESIASFNVNNKRSLTRLSPPIIPDNNSNSNSSSSSSSHNGRIDDDNRSFLITRTPSSESIRTTSTTAAGNHKRKLSFEKRKHLHLNKQVLVNDHDNNSPPGVESIIDVLKDELEREKSSARALQGQKEAIAKDLDYFCNLVDEVTEEKDMYKKKYQEEKIKNEELKSTIKTMELKTVTVGSQSQIESKDSEACNRLKADLKQAQRQIQILRQTMKQMLKADGRDFDEIYSFEEEGITRRKSFASDNNSKNKEKYQLLLQTGYSPEQQQQSPSSLGTVKSITSPSSPIPCYPNSHEDDGDLYSVSSSKDSHQSNNSDSYHHRNAAHVTPYEFLGYEGEDIVDDEQINAHNYMFSLAKKKSEEFSKKIAKSRRRKDELEEMLGEVDSQLNKVKQKLRPI